MIKWIRMKLCTHSYEVADLLPGIFPGSNSKLFAYTCKKCGKRITQKT